MDLKQRADLIEAYAEACVDDMDLKTLMGAMKETIEIDLSYQTDEEVAEAIRNFYPHLLEGTEWE